MIEVEVGRLAARAKQRLMPRRFPLRWLARGPYWYLVKEPLLEKVVPEEGWIAWEQARDALAIEQLMVLALGGMLYGDALGGQPWQARLWADDMLHIAVAHAVLTLVDRCRARLPHRQAAPRWWQTAPESWEGVQQPGGQA
jgi:hypothetical protein